MLDPACRALGLAAVLAVGAGAAMAAPVQFQTYTLDNGLRVILHEDHGTPLVAVNVWYHVGSKNEKPGRTGFAHLFEHMLFQGSENIRANEHFELVQRYGGVANGTTWYDRTNYFETLPSNVLELGLWLESDRMGFFEKGLTQPKLDNQREVVKNERRTRVDNQPYGTWLEKMTETAYPPEHFYHWPVIGYMKDLDAATLDDVKEFFRTYYAPNNAVLTVAGDIDLEKAKELIAVYFDSIPRGPDAPRPVSDFKLPETEKRLVVEDTVQLPKIFMLYHGPKIGTADYYAGDLLSTLLSSGKSSRLYHRLVYELQLAKDVTAFVFPLEEAGQFHFQATCREGVDPETLENALQKEIDRLSKEEIGEVELERARNRAETDLARQLDAIGDRADHLSANMVYFGDPGRINSEMEQYRRVTSSDLAAFSRKYLKSIHRVVAWYVPPKPAAPAPEPAALPK